MISSDNTNRKYFKLFVIGSTVYVFLHYYLNKDLRDGFIEKLRRYVYYVMALDFLIACILLKYLRTAEPEEDDFNELENTENGDKLNQDKLTRELEEQRRLFFLEQHRQRLEQQKVEQQKLEQNKSDDEIKQILILLTHENNKIDLVNNIKRNYFVQHINIGYLSEQNPHLLYRTNKKNTTSEFRYIFGVINNVNKRNEEKIKNNIISIFNSFNTSDPLISSNLICLIN